MYSKISYGSEGPRDVRMWQFEPTSTTVLMYRTYSHGSEGDEVKRITKERLQYRHFHTVVKDVFSSSISLIDRSTPE